MEKTKSKSVRARSSATPASKPTTKPNSVSKPIELPDGMWERIAQKAYELYEQRGGREGQALEDWLEAETIVMEEIHEARE